MQTQILTQIFLLLSFPFSFGTIQFLSQTLQAFHCLEELQCQIYVCQNNNVTLFPQ
jgi:hypothetical protein